METCECRIRFNQCDRLALTIMYSTTDTHEAIVGARRFHIPHAFFFSTTSTQLYSAFESLDRPCCVPKFWVSVSRNSCQQRSLQFCSVSRCGNFDPGRGGENLTQETRKHGIRCSKSRAERENPPMSEVNVTWNPLFGQGMHTAHVYRCRHAGSSARKKDVFEIGRRRQRWVLGQVTASCCGGETGSDRQEKSRALMFDRATKLAPGIRILCGFFLKLLRRLSEIRSKVNVWSSARTRTHQKPCHHQTPLLAPAKC
jgi:hypothetical protein